MMARPITKENRDKIVREAERFRERIEYMEEEAIFELSQVLHLSDATVRHIWEETI